MNPASGTEATWGHFAGPGCNPDTNEAQDPNPATNASGDDHGVQDLLENNAANIAVQAASYFPSDTVDQAILVSTSLYYMADGVYNTNAYAATATIGGTGYGANKLTLNQQSPTTAEKLNNEYPAARTLFNIVSANTVRAPAAGFVNWVCDNSDYFTKATDPGSGNTYDTELTNIIQGNFGYIRLSDATSTAFANPGDNLSAPNNTCDALESVDTTATSANVTLASGGAFPPAITAGTAVVGTGIPASTTVSEPASSYVDTTTAATDNVTLTNGGSFPSTITAGTAVSDPSDPGLIPAGDTVSTNNGTSLTLVTPPTAAVPEGATLLYNGGTTLVLSNAATATNTAVQVNYPNLPPVLSYVNP